MKVHACQNHAHRRPARERLAESLAALKESHIRVTEPRRKILAALVAAERPLSSEEIFKKTGCDLVTIYRSLAAMERAALVRRQDLGDQVRRYELADTHHHHYVRCRSCGSVEAFDGCDLDTSLAARLSRRGYTGIHHQLDVLALCERCQ